MGEVRKVAQAPIPMNPLVKIMTDFIKGEKIRTKPGRQAAIVYDEKTPYILMEMGAGMYSKVYITDKEIYDWLADNQIEYIKQTKKKLDSNPKPKEVVYSSYQPMSQKNTDYPEYIEEYLDTGIDVFRDENTGQPYIKHRETPFSGETRKYINEKEVTKREVKRDEKGKPYIEQERFFGTYKQKLPVKEWQVRKTGK